MQLLLYRDLVGDSEAEIKTWVNRLTVISVEPLWFGSKLTDDMALVSAWSIACNTKHHVYAWYEHFGGVTEVPWVGWAWHCSFVLRYYLFNDITDL